jgi:four helix bundle protein
MSGIQSHHDLDVWQKAMELAVAVYEITRQFPHGERYGLVSQLQRSAASVPANIAEGKARGTRKDYAQFIAIARGSLMETETYVQLATRLGYISPATANPALRLIHEINLMLQSLRRALVDPPGQRQQSTQNPEPGS